MPFAKSWLVEKQDFHLAASEMSTASVVQWSEFLAATPEVPGSIPGATRFSE
jgi:hypothetical protein